MDSWAERYVDEQVDRAWLKLRMALAARFEAGLDEGDMEPIDFTSATGELLSVNVAEDHVVILAGDSVVVSENVDEAAYSVYEILHDEWQVIHPIFLETPLIEVPSVEVHPIVVSVPLLGRADTRETLQTWVVSTFQETCDELIKVAPNDDIGWLGEAGAAATVSIRDQNWIEVWSVLATQVSFKKASRVVKQLSRQYTGVSFSLHRDTLVMSRMVDAGPFVPQHLTDALSMHLDLAMKLAWVRESVLRKRVKRERDLVVPPELIALLPSANRLHSGALADLVVCSAAGSDTVLEAWRTVARRESRRAHTRPRGPDDPQRVNYRLRMGWMRLGRAIDYALETQGSVEDVA